MRELSPEKRVQKAHSSLVMSSKFAMLSGILLLGKSEVLADENWKFKRKTACTNGRDKFYHEDFIKTLDDKQVAFLVAHENFHVLLRQLSVWQRLYKQDAGRANRACDFVINLMITDLDSAERVVKFIPGGCLNPEFRGMDAQQVFNLLPPSGEDGEGGSGDGESLDAHDWEDAQSMTDEAKQQLKEAVEMAARQADILAGKMKGVGPRDLGIIPTPKVDWRKQLRDFVNSVVAGNDMSTWRKPRRRLLWQGTYMPTSFSETVGRAMISPDTSGSTFSVFKLFMAEMGKIVIDVKPESTDIVYWGSDVVKTEHYEPSQYETMVEDTRPMDGGGTIPSCLKSYLDRQPVVDQPAFQIIFTDGYVGGDWPKFDVPTLWVIGDNKSTDSPHGVTIHINSEDYDD